MLIPSFASLTLALALITIMPRMAVQSQEEYQILNLPPATKYSMSMTLTNLPLVCFTGFFNWCPPKIHKYGEKCPQKSAIGIPLGDQPPQSVLKRRGLVH